MHASCRVVGKYKVSKRVVRWQTPVSMSVCYGLAVVVHVKPFSLLARGESELASIH